MDKIKIQVSGNIAKVIEKPRVLTSGTVGLLVEFVFEDEQWDSFNKTAVFRAGCLEKIVTDVDNETTVPWEVMDKHGLRLEIGIYGVNGDGSVAIPTVWATVGVIRDGADPYGDKANSPALPIWKKLEKEFDDRFQELEAIVQKNSVTFEDEENHTEVSIAIGVPSEREYEDGYPTVGIISFYETNKDKPVRLLNVADGTEANHAATVGQVVLTSAQTLTDEQKRLARENIGAAAVGEGGGSAEGAVLYTQQNLTAKQKVQAKENIGASDFYHTEREEVGAAHEDINSAYIFGLYRALAEKYPGRVKEQELRVETDEGTFVNYEYVISTGERSTNGYFTKLHDADEHIRKPKYLVMSGIHGRERKAAISVYRFVCDLLSGHNVPKEFAEGAIIHVLPVANPTGFNAYTRWNGNQVDINRNFPHGGEWVETWYDSDFDGETDDYTNGDSAASEMETKAIIQWMEDNNDAQLFIDAHSGSQTNEIVCVLGVPGNDQVDAAKNIALRGIDRIIPYWRDVIQYPASMKEADPYYEDGKLVFGTKDEPVIFAYSVSAKESLKSSAFYYASNVVGIPGIALEMSTYYGDWDEWYQDDREQKYELAYNPESIAAGAEIVGNILIEFYEQALFGEVNEDMKQIDSKLDDILQRVSFHVESGTLELTSEPLPNSSALQRYHVDCSPGAKIFVLAPTGTTEEEIKSKAYANAIGYYTLDIKCNFANVTETESNKAYQGVVTAWIVQSSGGRRAAGGITADNTNGVDFDTYRFAVGTYVWKAYYWND